VGLGRNRTVSRFGRPRDRSTFAGMRRRGATEPTPAPATGGVRKWGPVDILSAPDNRAVLRKLVAYTTCVALAPPGSFYLVKRLLPPSKHRDAIAAICAVVVLNLFIAAYVISAFREPDDFDREPAPRVGIWKDRREE